MNIAKYLKNLVCITIYVDIIAVMDLSACRGSVGAAVGGAGGALGSVGA